jgi:hypothetical protein
MTSCAIAFSSQECARTVKEICRAAAIGPAIEDFGQRKCCSAATKLLFLRRNRAFSIYVGPIYVGPVVVLVPIAGGKLLAIAFSDSPGPALIPRERLILEHAMKHQRHFDTSEAAQRDATQIRKMIGDLDRTVHLLDCDIATEEQRARISDRSAVAYPVLARMLTTRRDNLKETITALERRLAKPNEAEMLTEPA